jgi:hypothetical protein
VHEVRVAMAHAVGGAGLIFVPGALERAQHGAEAAVDGIGRPSRVDQECVESDPARPRTATATGPIEYGLVGA